MQGARQGGGREEVQERGATRESHVRPSAMSDRQHRRLEVERGEEDWSGEGVCLVLPYQGSLKRVGIHEHTRTQVGDVASSSGKPLPLLSLSLYMCPLSGKSLHMRLYVSVYVPALRQVSAYAPICLCICARFQASLFICAYMSLYMCPLSGKSRLSVYVGILPLLSVCVAILLSIYVSAYCYKCVGVRGDKLML